MPRTTAGQADPRDRLFFFDAAPEACLVLGYDLRIMDANRAFLEATGWPLDRLLRRPLGEFASGVPSAAGLASFLPDWSEVLSFGGSFQTREGRSVPCLFLMRGLPARNKIYSICRPETPSCSGQRLLREGAATPLAAPAWARRQAPL